MLVSELLKNNSLFTVFANFHGVNTHMGSFKLPRSQNSWMCNNTFSWAVRRRIQHTTGKSSPIVSLAPSSADEVIPSNGSDICSSVLGTFWEVSSLSYPLHRFRQYFCSLLHLFGEELSFMLLSQGYLKKLTLNFCEATADGQSLGNKSRDSVTPNRKMPSQDFENLN